MKISKHQRDDPTRSKYLPEILEMDSIEAWCAWFETNLSTKVSAGARQKYSSLLIENEVFDLETFSECIDLEPDFLSAKINVKNIALQNTIKVTLFYFSVFRKIIDSHDIIPFL